MGDLREKPAVVQRSFASDTNLATANGETETLTAWAFQCSGRRGYGRLLVILGTAFNLLASSRAAIFGSA